MSSAQIIVVELHDVLIRTNLENHYFRIEDTRTSEGREKIKKCAEEFINNPDTKRISDGLQKEKATFNGFEEALKEQIAKVKTS